MTDETETPKPPQRWLAFLLNLILPPAGYIYSGRPLAAIMLTALMVLLPIGLMAWTLSAPPGIYSFGSSGPFLAWQITLTIRVLAGAHAAWRPRPRTSVKGAVAWLVAIGLILVPTATNLALRFALPFRFYDIPSGSMIPTLRPGDVMLVRGDHLACRTPDLAAGMVVTEKKQGGVIFVRRLIAGPGQTVELNAGRLIIDGRPVKTEVVGQDTQAGAEVRRETLPGGASYLVHDLGERETDDFGPVTVPQGAWFVLGDNRDNSLDSRIDGFAPAPQICGRAIRIITSNDKAAIGRPL